MNRPMRALRGVAASAAVAATCTAVVPAIMGSIAQATTTRHATTDVYVHATPANGGRILGVLLQGHSVTVTGPNELGWTPVLFNGQKGYIYRAFLADGSGSTSSSGQTSDESTASRSGATGTAYTTAWLNLRTGASLNSRVITVLPKGGQVTRTGVVAGNWVKVSTSSGNGWVYSSYLTSVRTSSSSASTASRSTTSTTSTPTVTGTRYATTYLNLWTSSTGSGYADVVNPGTALKVTGTVSNGRAQVVVDGTVRWVTNQYTSTTARTNTSSSTSSTTSRSTTRTAVSSSSGITGSCVASFYDDPQLTANGETFDPSAMTAANKTLPFNTMVRVTNVANGKSTVVRINDRGPYVAGRCLDLSRAAFAQIASLDAGTVQVTYTVL